MPARTVVTRFAVALSIGAVLLAAACPAPPQTGFPGGPGEGEGEPPPPPAVCAAPIEARDLSTATVITSCDEASLDAAIASVTAAGGGAIAFSCGGPVTIPITTEKLVTTDLTLDGADEVTLDGLGSVRLFRVQATFDVQTPRFTLQHITLRGGRTFGNDLSGGGAAVYREGGSLEVIDSFFEDNIGNTDGQDTAGGAIFSFGVGPTTIVGSRFDNNSASNGGALGNLGNSLFVVNSVFSGNSATGNGGNPGNGGNGGAISVDGQDKEVALCGVTIEDSTAGAFGGALFRVAYSFNEPTTLDRVRIARSHIDDRDPSSGGAAYLQGTVVAIRNSTLDENEARSAGAIHFGPNSSVFIENTSFLGNTALSSLAGGIFLNGVTTGSIVNATFWGNAAPGELAFGGAITGEGASVSMRNTLILGSIAGNGFNPISCTTRLSGGEGSFQFPSLRAGGDSDDPDARCADTITFADVPLDGAVVDDSGHALLVLPAQDSPAVGAGVDCPATDARGEPRPSSGCTSGAAEIAP
jgi:hypothetical protein